jgi:hypothetical protein
VSVRVSVGRGHSQTSANTARDDFIPLAADGSPALLGAWRYMIWDPEENSDGYESEEGAEQQ